MSYPIELIANVISDYEERSSGEGGAAPYDGASLAMIYGERVQQLRDLATAGFATAQWRYDDIAKVNRWFGVAR